MWQDKVTQRYRWAGIRGEKDELLYELSKAEDEEEVALYLLRLHYDNETELKSFTPAQKEKIKKLLSILIRDTIKHREFLAAVIKELDGGKDGKR